MQSIKLIAFDFGSTTSSVLVAKAMIYKDIKSGQSCIGDFQVLFQPEPVFTPFQGDQLDRVRILMLLNKWKLQWKHCLHAKPDAGGVIITGLAAQKQNAKLISKLIRNEIGSAVIAATNDMWFESWLSFMGSTSQLSKEYPDKYFINFDIGGGTTNSALGKAGEVLSSDFKWIGARHVQFIEGSYKISDLSKHAVKLFKKLGIQKKTGQSLIKSEVELIVAFYVNSLIDILKKYKSFKPVITFSGGVGELVYRGQNLPSKTYYGDLGVDFAKAILMSKVLSRDLKKLQPYQKGRATIYGLARHNTEVSGSSLFGSIKRQGTLSDLPIIGRLTQNLDLDIKIKELIRISKKLSGGSCIQVDLNFKSIGQIKRVGKIFYKTFIKEKMPLNIPIVVFMNQNLGKSFGNYATNWRRLEVDLIVIDEVSSRNAEFVTINKTGGNRVLVSFYGGS